jgi:(1->4)-alpha-D-glucan 1-alpha-D-glucosylmutase
MARSNSPWRWPDGKVKLALTHRLLRLRQELPDLFTRGGYAPLDCGGATSDHVVAYARAHRDQKLAVIVGRFFAKLTDAEPSSYTPTCWRDGWVALHDGEGQEILSGRVLRGENGRIALADLFRALPVAVVVTR